MKRHILFLAGIPGLMLVFGLLLFTGCPMEEPEEDPSSPSPISYPYTVEYVKNTFPFGSSEIEGGPWPEVQTLEPGTTTTITLPGSGLTYSNYDTIYTLSGWKGPDGEIYAVGDSYTIDTTGFGETMLFIAQWSELPYYYVSYDANGGTGTVPTEQNARSGKTITLSKNDGDRYYSKLTKFGHTFIGWNTAADGTGTAYPEEASFTVTGETTLYAQWTLAVELSKRVYVGVVAFNDTTSEYPLSNNLGGAKLFIHDKANDVDSTALCYAVSKATTLFGAAPTTLDNLFVVSFTDGLDNSSSALYTGVPQGIVYDKAKTDLEKITGMRSYAIGFGSEPNATSMQKLVVNKGQYRAATSSNLNTVFQDIAYSIMASSKNIELVTQNGTYTEEYPKYFKITVTAKSNVTYSATIKCKLVGTTFTIIENDPGSYLSFEAPAAADVEGSKMRIPLNNLKYERDGSEWFISNVAVQVSYTDTDDYRTDTEDGSASTSNNTKKTGVVLVLDCSKSLGTSFESVKNAAYSFINTLLSTDTQ